MSFPKSRIHPVTNTNSDDYQQVMAIYKSSFPANERQPESTVKQRVDKGDSILYALVNEEKEVVAFAMFWDFRNSEFVLLDYFAVKKKFRNKGYGSYLLKNVFKLFIKKQKTVVAEIEHPKFGRNRKDRMKRLDFYLRNGCYILENVRYILPALDGKHKTEMLLLVSADDENQKFSRKSIKELLTRLYTEVYRKDRKNADLTMLLKLIPRVVHQTSTL